MDENEKKKIDTEDLKNETKETVNKVKETIKKVDIKEDTKATKIEITSTESRARIARIFSIIPIMMAEVLTILTWLTHNRNEFADYEKNLQVWFER